MRSFWGAAGDWLERSSSRIGAISSLIGVAGSVATAAVATHAAINEHRYAVISFLAVAVTLFLFAWPRLRRRLWRTASSSSTTPGPAI